MLQTLKKELAANSFVRNLYDAIRGIKRAKRYQQLYDEIKKNKAKRIMEIGTWNGERAIQMIETAKKNYPAEAIEYYGFDIFEIMNDEIYEKEVSKRPPTREEVEKKLKKTGAKIKLYAGFTQDTMSQAVSELPAMDFIYIDGGHSIETIENDWRYAQEVMDENTVVIFDDYWSGQWGARKDAGCQSLIDELDEAQFKWEVLPIRDEFEKDWGVLKINYAKVKRV